jgi:hypothetical protein
MKLKPQMKLEELVNLITSDLGTKSDALLVVNGFGATPAMELYLMFNSAKTNLPNTGSPCAARLWATMSRPLIWRVAHSQLHCLIAKSKGSGTLPCIHQR